MNEYRCTRGSLYPKNTKTSSMQGHYICANSSEEALELMKYKFPDESTFNIELWKSNISRTLKGLC